MRCPKCDTPTFVKDSRPKGDSISRRRECTACGSRFSTMEITVEAYLKITRRK